MKRKMLVRYHYGRSYEVEAESKEEAKRLAEDELMNDPDINDAGWFPVRPEEFRVSSILDIPEGG